MSSQSGIKLWSLAAIQKLVVAASVFALMVSSGASVAQNVNTGERIVPAIWVDPDGCEHWVFDDGVEGYMTPHVRRDGRPVCRSGNTCSVLSSDQLFATDSHKIAASRARDLKTFFTTVQAKAFIITGHTDSRAGDDYNLALSERRANAVAAIARDAGAAIVDVRGYGERDPKASNRSAAGRAENRRVEIICVH